MSWKLDGDHRSLHGVNECGHVGRESSSDVTDFGLDRSELFSETIDVGPSPAHLDGQSVDSIPGPAQLPRAEASDQRNDEEQQAYRHRGARGGQPEEAEPSGSWGWRSGGQGAGSSLRRFQGPPGRGHHQAYAFLGV